MQSIPKGTLILICQRQRSHGEGSCGQAQRMDFLMHWSINLHFLRPWKNKQPGLLLQTTEPWKHFCGLCCCPGATDGGLRLQKIFPFNNTENYLRFCQGVPRSEKNTPVSAIINPDVLLPVF